MRRKVPHPQSLMAFASDRLRTMFCAARSSITITSWSRNGTEDTSFSHARS